MSVSDIQMRNEDGTFQSIFPITVEQGGTGADNTNNALDNLGVKDYVVAEGTSGNWYYRKYESGVAEWDCEICPNCLDKWIKDAKKFLSETNVDDDPSFCVNSEIIKVYSEDNEF